jgi:NTP pyrophosphatase (non-canonical NTP hydrolase)
MSAHFNNLTPAQAERLAMLAEEAGELVHVIGKALRHGLDSTDPTAPTPVTNASLIAAELGDLYYAARLLAEAGDIRQSAVVLAVESAAARKPRWLHHQPVCATRPAPAAQAAQGEQGE